MHVAPIAPDAGEVFVAKQCDHCGKTLPSDTIRYCPGCGKLVASFRSAKRSLSEDPPAWMKQLETSLTQNRSNVPLRELNVKVWDEEETKDLTLPQSEVDSVGGDLDGVDALPTSPLMVESVEDIETRPYAAQPRNTSHEMQKPILFQQRQSMQRPMTPVSLPLSQPQFSPAQPVRQTPPGSMSAPPLDRPKKSNRKGLALVFGLLLILFLGGVFAWVILTQPFAVPEITKITQPFNNTSLGLSLQYPKNWAVAINKQKGTVSFYDNNHTDQVNITIVATGNQSLNQYLNKVVSSLGMSGQRTQTELSFAGATWQQIQASVQQSGANYTATLLLTMHGEHFYTILQLAPASTYPLEEQLVFSKMRSSFQF